VGRRDEVLYTNLTKGQAEHWVQQQEDFDHAHDSEYYVIRRAHGSWVKM
jgi:hypothetical protein